jgi:diguanylate cyclase (GGDEF)-like protein
MKQESKGTTQQHDSLIEGDAGGLLGRLSHHLTILEKRDCSLWAIIVGVCIMVGAGLVAVIFPNTLLNRGNLHLEFNIPSQLFAAAIALLALFNAYMITRWLESRRVRSTLVSSTLRNELVRLQSFTDPLTEVYNRRSLDTMANRYISHASRLSKPLTFGLVDVDRFRQINSTFGHLTGDVVLAEIATILKSATRGCDAVIRYGGDEFVLILADATLEGAEQVAERIDKCLQEWNAQKQLKNFELSLSVGFSGWTEGKSLDKILTEADLKMYLAKEAARKSGFRAPLVAATAIERGA